MVKVIDNGMTVEFTRQELSDILRALFELKQMQIQFPYPMERVALIESQLRKSTAVE